MASRLPRRIYLATARERQGLTQHALTELSGVPQSVISRLEHHASPQPSARTLLALAAALTVHPENLRFGPDPRPPKKRMAKAALGGVAIVEGSGL